MRKTAMLLALALILSLFGCGKAAMTDTSDTSGTTAPTVSESSSQTTAPTTTTAETYPDPTIEPPGETIIYTGVPEQPSDGYPVKSLKLAGNDISRYKVVLPADATAPEQTAANELINYIELATGVRIETAQSAGYAIILRGESGGELGGEGFHIFFEGENLVIAGGRPRGVLYGVYTFLEDYVGCRFYTPDFEVIKKADLIDVPRSTNDRQLPVIDVRYSYWHSIIISPSLKAKLKINHDVPTPELGGGISFTGGFVHTFAAIVPEEVYGASHPEYFNGSSQLCLTNPEVLEIAIAYVRSLLARNPDAKIISVSQNDNIKYCTCANCMAITMEEDSPAGLLLRFVNAIARDIAADYPNVLIDTLAYQYTRKAPKITRPEPNVQIRLCSIECCFSHPLDDPNCPLNTKFMKDLEAWAAICDHLAVWDYTTNFSNYCSPFANFRVLRENVRIYAEHGVYYLFEQGTYNSPSGEFGDLKGYLLAKLLWDPYMSEEKYNALMDEFLADYYGAGWISLREYIDLLVESGNKKHTTIFGDPPLYFRSEEWPRITALWEEAKSKATAAQLWRIERSYSCIVQAKMSYYKYYMVRTPEFREKYFEMQEQFAAYIARFGLYSWEGGY